MEVKFSHPMDTALDLSSINPTQIDLFIDPAFDRHLEDDFDISSLNFTWKTTQFEKDLLSLKLAFNDALAISPEIE